MNLCSHNHPEVCFEEKKCPICDVLADKDKQIEGLQDSLREAESTITNLKTELDSK